MGEYRRKPLKERRKDFKEMKGGLLERFLKGEDPILIGQLLTLVETIELKDTGSVSKLKGKVDLTKKGLNESLYT